MSARRFSLRLASDGSGARRPWSVEALVLGTVALIVVAGNLPFWREALEGRPPMAFETWRFVVSAAVVLVALHALPVLLMATRHTVRPLLAFLLLATAVAMHLMQRYGVVLDPSMLRNALRTHPAEAQELITTSLGLTVLVALLLGAALWRIPLLRLPLPRALTRRAAVIAAVAGAGVVALLAGFQDISSLMRNQKELRYRVTPGNVVYSTGRVLAGDLRLARLAREPLQALERLPSPPARKPRLLVVVVGETARAMNFSLNGYGRTTNPELAALPVVNFPQTTACGTSTEVSLPCMFSSQGRADYDEDLIQRSESLVQLLSRAGARVVWLDNQSGCKGVCAGLETRDLSPGRDPALCPDGRCFDGVLVQGLQQVLAEQSPGDTRDLVVVLHQLGNHGPAYHKRYPPEFARFLPACKRQELRDCSREEIVNAYDNAILYTDHLLARTIGVLREQAGRYDVGMMYASDHGESLGEKGLYLHGMPQSIAPREQLEVPMVWWFGGDGAQGWNGLDAGCLRQRATAPAHHDDLYHSVLGLFELRTPRYVAARDLISPCRVKP